MPTSYQTTEPTLNSTSSDPSVTPGSEQTAIIVGTVVGVVGFIAIVVVIILIMRYKHITPWKRYSQVKRHLTLRHKKEFSLWPASKSQVRRRSVTSPYQTTTPPRTESDKSSSKTSSYNEVDDLELTARIREEAESVEYTRPSPPTAHAHSTRSHAERLTAVPPEAVTIEQAARAQQPEYVEIENEVRPNGDDGYLVPAGQYASLNPATRSEEGHEYENLGSKPTEPSSTPGYSGLVKSTKREKHLYDRLKRETNQTVEAEEDEPAYAIALEQMPGPTFTKL